MGRALKTLGWMGGAACVGLAAAAWAHEEARAPASALTNDPRLPVIREAPAFALSDATGHEVRLADLRGKPALLAFIFTRCSGVCPTLSLEMARLQKKLERAHVPASLVSMTVDPAEDDAETLAAYARAFKARPGWHFLRETPERMAPVLAAYGEWTRRLASGVLDHPARLHLIDAQGRVREIYSLAFFDEEQAFLDIRALQREAR